MATFPRKRGIGVSTDDPANQIVSGSVDGQTLDLAPSSSKPGKSNAGNVSKKSRYVITGQSNGDPGTNQIADPRKSDDQVRIVLSDYFSVTSSPEIPAEGIVFEESDVEEVEETQHPRIDRVVLSDHFSITSSPEIPEQGLEFEESEEGEADGAQLDLSDGNPSNSLDSEARSVSQESSMIDSESNSSDYEGFTDDDTISTIQSEDSGDAALLETVNKDPRFSKATAVVKKNLKFSDLRYINHQNLGVPIPWEFELKSGSRFRECNDEDEEDDVDGDNEVDEGDVFGMEDDIVEENELDEDDDLDMEDEIDEVDADDGLDMENEMDEDDGLDMEESNW